MVALRRARTEVVTRDAAERAAKTKADQAVKDAQSSQDAAVAALTAAQETFREQQAEIDRLAAERTVAQQKLDAARAWSEPASVPAAALEQAAVGAMVPMAGTASGSSSGDRWDPAAAASGTAPGGVVPPYGKLSEWDLTLPMVPSAFLSGDPIQIINAVLQIAQRHGIPARIIGRVVNAESGTSFTISDDTFTAPVAWLAKAFHEAIPLAMDGDTPAEQVVSSSHAPTND
jgi:hypothetical protein